MENEKDDLVEAIIKKTFADGEKTRLSCAAALQIAREFGVKPSEIGVLCNDRKIRISNCQLGCFK